MGFLVHGTDRDGCCSAQSKSKTTKTMKLNALAGAIVTALLMGSLATQASAITPGEASSILFMKQEEKLARDVYNALHARWGAAVFKQIAASEQQHMNAVHGLVVRYQLKDTTPAAPGVFSYPELQELYDSLVADGDLSLKSALQVGVTIEEVDIADLRSALASTRQRPLVNVFGNLLRGSLNHLAAFKRALR
jgi:hypothetical protein